MPTLQHLHPSNPHPLCLCGCGSPNKDMARFNQGHASKLRSYIADGEIPSTLPDYVLRYIQATAHPCLCCGLPLLGPAPMGLSCALGQCKCNTFKQHPPE